MGYFKDLIQGMGTSVGGGLAGSLGGQIGYGLGELTGYNDALQQRQLRQQHALTNMQRDANLALMKDSYKQQLELWKNTNYSAQMGQIRAAGLNPALIYGTSGTGGSTGGGGASVGGGNASGESERMMANIASSQNGMAMMKTAAEIELIKANADLARAQKPKTEAETSGILQQIDVAKQNIQNLQAQEQLTKVQTLQTDIQNAISTATKETVIEKVKAELNNLNATYDEIYSTIGKNNAETETINKLRNAQYADIVASAALKRSEIPVNAEQAKFIKEQTLVLWPQLEVAIRNSETNQGQLDNSINRLLFDKEQILPWQKQAFTIEQGRQLLTNIAQAIMAMYLMGKFNGNKPAFNPYGPQGPR